MLEAYDLRALLDIDGYSDGGATIVRCRGCCGVSSAKCELDRKKDDFYHVRCLKGIVENRGG